MDFRDVDDLKLGVSRVNRSCAPHDLKMDGSLVVNRGRRMNDRLGDLNLVAKMDGNLCRHTNVTDDRNLGVTKVGNRDHRKNGMDDRNDLMMVVCHVNRNCVRHDRKTDVNLDGTTDVSRGLHMSDLLVDQNLDVNRVNRRTGVHLNAQLVYEHRVDLTIDPECYVRRDQMTDVNLDAMSHRVKLTGDRSTSCDRMSRDHLQCDHQMMRHRDTNRMDVKNLGVKNLDAMKMMNHRVNRRMMDDLMKVGPKMI